MTGVQTCALPISTQGCSIRVFGALKGSKHQPTANVQRILDDEKKKGFLDVNSYSEVTKKVNAFRTKLRDRVGELNKKFGNKTVGLGAPARGVVVLNYCGLGAGDLDLVVDDTPLKQGRLVPGMHIPVGGWDKLAKMGDVPRAYLLLSWNYRKDMIERLKKTVKKGVVIIPFPEYMEVPVEGA